ncbi:MULTISPECIES: SGNH/GDSL hydrolase family protein [unclassified Isoptericola]|uniref:SGNH/GDSL hydrolase family protein n=1 Tax=unclassified Isoptericola TaxID=2623355 RepID=UPI00364B3C0F
MADVYEVTWGLSGVDSLRWGLQAVSMWRPPVTTRRTTLEVPGRHGVISAGLPVFDEPTVTLTMWLHGSTQDDIENATLELYGLLGAPGLILSRTSGGLVTSAPAVLVSVAPDEFTTAAEATFEVVLAVPGVFLRGTESDTTITVFGRSVSVLAGSTAPVGDAVLRIDDPDNPVVTDVVSGTGISWTGSMPGWYLFVDAGAMRAWLSQDADAWTPPPGALVRKNFVQNPSFEVSGALWVATGGTGTITASFPQMWGGGGAGSRCMQLAADGSSPYLTLTQLASTSAPVTPGQWVALAALVAGETSYPAAGGGIRPTVAFTGSANTFHSGPVTPAPFYAGRRAVFMVQAPATATAAYINVQAYSGSTGVLLPAGHRMWVDSVMIGVGDTQAEALAQLGSRTGPLMQWDVAVAAGRAQALVVGDSISEGSAVSTLAKRWQSLLQERLAPTGPEFPYIPAAPANSVPGWPVSWTGATGTNPSWGLGIRTRVLTDATSTVTFTFTGTSFKLAYLRTASTGVMKVVVDGGAPTLVDTYSATTNLSAVWSSPALVAGAHTVTVTRDASSVAGRSVYVQGLHAYAGDEGTGVRVLDGAHAGFSTADFVSGDRLNAGIAALAAGGGADLLFIGLLNNDYGQGVSLADYEANLRSIIAGYRNAGFVGSVVLLGMARQAGADPVLWQEYHDRLSIIAAGDAAVSYLDLRAFIPDADDAPELYADGVHPNDAGQALIAAGIGDYVTQYPQYPVEVSYFDGDTTDAAWMANAWTGTPHGSTSTQTITPEAATAGLDYPAAGRLQLWPRMVATDPSDRAARVTVTGASEVVVRARPAYL